MDEIPAPATTILLLQVISIPQNLLLFRRAIAAWIPSTLVILCWFLTAIHLMTERGLFEIAIHWYQFVLMLFILFKKNKVEPVAPWNWLRSSSWAWPHLFHLLHLPTRSRGLSVSWSAWILLYRRRISLKIQSIPGERLHRQQALEIFFPCSRSGRNLQMAEHWGLHPLYPWESICTDHLSERR